MTFRRVKDGDYNRCLQRAFDLSTNYLTDLGAKLHFHDDIVNSDEYEWPEGEPHPVDLLEAQIDMEGAEEEVDLTRELVSTLGQLIILRKARQRCP
jgi:hypothetical protein